MRTIFERCTANPIETGQGQCLESVSESDGAHPLFSVLSIGIGIFGFWDGVY